jgi:hypothetical protein
MSEHRHTPEEERRNREAALDETIAATFPASDPASTIPNPDEDEAAADVDDEAEDADADDADGRS